MIDAEAYKPFLIAKLKQSEHYLSANDEMRGYMLDAIIDYDGCFVDSRLCHPRLVVATPDWLEKQGQRWFMQLTHEERMSMKLRDWEEYHADEHAYIRRRERRWLSTQS